MKLPDPVLLDGIAARFKGGRTYVHGSDIIEYLDRCAANDLNAYLAKIEFRHPLERHGVLQFAAEQSELELETASAHGSLQQGVDLLHFVILPTDQPISAFGAFDENALINETRFDLPGSALLRHIDGASATEHASSAMKALSRMLLPQHEKWWFARCQLDRSLPNSFEVLELVLKRVMAKALVKAELRFDNVNCGELAFVGAAK
ncbi:MAG: hypothetical protein ABJN14_01095 [Paracoccaceae bacterium]